MCNDFSQKSSFSSACVLCVPHRSADLLSSSFLPNWHHTPPRNCQQQILPGRGRVGREAKGPVSAGPRKQTVQGKQVSQEGLQFQLQRAGKCWEQQDNPSRPEGERRKPLSRSRGSVARAAQAGARGDQLMSSLSCLCFCCSPQRATQLEVRGHEGPLMKCTT